MAEVCAVFLLPLVARCLETMYKAHAYFYVCCGDCVHLVAFLNAAFCMTCSLLMLVGDARGDHRGAGLITVL